MACSGDLRCHRWSGGDWGWRTTASLLGQPEGPSVPGAPPIYGGLASDAKLAAEAWLARTTPERPAETCTAPGPCADLSASSSVPMHSLHHFGRSMLSKLPPPPQSFHCLPTRLWFQRLAPEACQDALHEKAMTVGCHRGRRRPASMDGRSRLSASWKR